MSHSQIFHAVQFDPSRAETIGRVKRAKATWEVLYKAGVIPVYLTKYTRSAKNIGDDRDLPYLKDLLDLARRRTNPEDIIMFSNDDNLLHPLLPDYLRYHVALFGACASFRHESDGPIQISLQVKNGTVALYPSTHSAGQDVFAFTREWLDRHWDDIPDFLLGASEWDWCLTMIIRKEKGIRSTQENIRFPIWPAEIPLGYVAHEMHKPSWIDADRVNAAPSQIHNKKLFAEWLAANNPTFRMNQYQGRPAPRIGTNGKPLLTIRRSQSLGDVLAATCVATALMDMGHEIEFQAHASTHPILKRHPRLKNITEPNGNFDVNLDDSYERHPARTRLHMAEMYVEKANEYLRKSGIRIPTVTNYAPRLVPDPELRSVVLARLSQYPKPWVMICPRSQNWVNRTILDEIWHDAAPQISGTKFWLGMKQAPHGIVDLICRRIDLLIEYIGAADILVTVDTGPMHIAAAIGTPMLVIQQAMSPALRLSDQRDWYSIDPPLNCLNCQKHICPINERHPPCQRIRPDYLALHANARLKVVTSEDISAVIAVYKPKMELLNRTIAAVLPQVSEIVIVGDLDTPWPIQGITSPNDRIRLVRKNATRTGYGKKINFGARHANGKYLWFVNDDCFPNPDAGAKMLALMQSDPKIGIVSHTLWYPDRTIQYHGKHRVRGGINFGHTDHRQPRGRYTEPVEQECACGASILVRRKAFYDAGAHDEDYYLYSDDDDLCMSIRKAGYKIVFEPRAEGIHIEHSSTGTLAQITPLLEKSDAIFRRKWERYFLHNPDPNVLGNFNYE